MRLLEKLSHWINWILMLAAGLVLLIMIGLTCANIFLRIVWIPIKGTFELMGFFGAVVTAFALGYTQMERGHTPIDVFVNLLSKKTRKVLNGINCFICMLFFCIVGWQMTRWATTLWKTGEVTETLRIVFFPFTYLVALGCFVLSLVLLVDFLRLFVHGKGA